jgi:hypothetical protein
MLCSGCSKLSQLHTNKKCLRCQGDVYLNISRLCETCSATDHQCSACLKKIVDPDSRRVKLTGCGHCGQK